MTRPDLRESAGLDASVNPGSVTVGLGTVSATVTYTCTDTSAPGGQAQLRVDFDQSGKDTSGEASVPCGVGDINQTQDITAAQVGMSPTGETTAVATLDDGTLTVGNTGNNDGAYIHGDPVVSFSGGTICVSGSYNCTQATRGNIFVNARQVNSSGEAVVGSSFLCDGSNRPFSATFRPNVDLFTVDRPVFIFIYMNTESVGVVNVGEDTTTNYVASS